MMASCRAILKHLISNVIYSYYLNILFIHIILIIVFIIYLIMIIDSLVPEQQIDLSFSRCDGSDRRHRQQKDNLLRYPKRETSSLRTRTLYRNCRHISQPE